MICVALIAVCLFMLLTHANSITNVQEGHVKGHLAIAMLLAATGTARADVFAFKDLDGFEKCMQLDHLVEKVNTGKGSQTRVLGPVEIRLRCLESAARLVSASKDKDLIMSFVKAAKRLSAPENSLDLISALIDTSLPACNDLAVYEVLTKALSYPKDNSHYLPRARAVVKRCLKDKDFRKDFLEEQDHRDPQVSGNACQILLEEKLVKSCKSK
jgi:hypothetical protein